MPWSLALRATSPSPTAAPFGQGHPSPSDPAGWAASSVRSARLRGPLLVRCLPRAQGTTEQGQGLESLVTPRAHPTPPHRGRPSPAVLGWAKCRGAERIKCQEDLPAHALRRAVSALFRLAARHPRSVHRLPTFSGPCPHPRGRQGAPDGWRVFIRPEAADMVSPGRLQALPRGLGELVAQVTGSCPPGCHLMAHTCHCTLALGPALPESKGKDFNTPFCCPQVQSWALWGNESRSLAPSMAGHWVLGDGGESPES